MRLPEIEKLHSRVIEKLKIMNGGGGSTNGFEALMDAARCFAVAEVCAALRKDLRSIESEILRENS